MTRATVTLPERARRPRWLLLPVVLPVVLALQACVVVPQTREVYDQDCRMLKRQMTLETAVLGGFKSCAGDGCAAVLAAAGAISAASAVISGSIMLVGNVVYWFEHQGQCGRAPPSEPPATVPQPVS